MQYYIYRKNSSNVNFADKKSLRIFLEENFAPMVEEAITKFMDSEIYDKGQTYTKKICSIYSTYRPVGASVSDEVSLIDQFGEDKFFDEIYRNWKKYGNKNLEIGIVR